MAADRRGWWQRAGTVRVRSTVAAVLVVGAVLLLGAMLLVTMLRIGLTDQIRAVAAVRAAEVAAQLESGPGVPALVSATQDEQLVQVLDEAGNVVTSSPNIAGRPAVAQLRPGESATVPTPLDEDDFIAVADHADSPDGPQTVIVALAQDSMFETTGNVTRLLAIGLPVLLVLVAVATWKAVGRALAPVAAIRGEVARISAAELHRRVPQPPGTDEIARLAATMNQMLTRLERAQESKQRFISDASHELRSPVASIRQHAEVALAHPGRTSVAELAETVLAEDLRVQRLVEDLLLLARVDEYTLQLRHQPVDVDDLVFDEARHLRATTDLRIDTTAVSAGRVDGDPAGLRRVLRNLGDNAARHARGRIAFALADDGSHVALSVDDDGPGIPPTDQERVFERFVRLDDARARHDGGTGLGLAIVAELVSAHGGRVSAADSDLGGARIKVILPSANGRDH
jgi:signal transduction histidine kinase